MQSVEKSFANGFAQKITSNQITLHILSDVCKLIFPVNVPIGNGPIDAQINFLFEIISFNTLLRNNGMLYFGDIDKSKTNTKTKTWIYIDKVEKSLYILHIPKIVKKCTLIDGLLAQDKCVYDPECQHVNRGNQTITPNDIDFDIDEHYVSSTEEEDSCDNIDNNNNGICVEEEEEEDEEDTEVESIEEPKGPLQIISIARHVNRSDGDEQIKQTRWYFHIQDLFCINGKNAQRMNPYDKYALANRFISSYDKVYNDMLCPFFFKNHIMGTYHRPTNPREISNPYTNDYTFFHKKIYKLLSYNPTLCSQYNTNPKARVRFEIKRHPEQWYIFELYTSQEKFPKGYTSQDKFPKGYTSQETRKGKYTKQKTKKESKFHSNAFIPSAECNLYCSDLVKKMKPPVIISCMFNTSRKVWTPIEHVYGESQPDQMTKVVKVENQI